MKLFSKILIAMICTSFIVEVSKACACLKYSTIDSLPQMDEYDFIGHVKITSDADLKKPTKDDFETIGELTVEIIELFKGDKTDMILEYAKNSSCDIGISQGEEWILFGMKVNGRISVVACDRNNKYKEKNGQRDWKYQDGIYELK